MILGCPVGLLHFYSVVTEELENLIIRVNALSRAFLISTRPYTGNCTLLRRVSMPSPGLFPSSTTLSPQAGRRHTHRHAPPTTSCFTTYFFTRDFTDGNTLSLRNWYSLASNSMYLILSSSGIMVASFIRKNSFTWGSSSIFLPASVLFMVVL